MKEIILSLVGIFLIISCKEESDTLLPEYQALSGTWKTQSVSYDSSGVRVTKTIAYDKMEILRDLSYKVYYQSVNCIENGEVRIVSQSSSGLVLYFEAHYPLWSSFAGSHIFTNVNVSLVKLTSDELVLRDMEKNYSHVKDYQFIRE